MFRRLSGISMMCHSIDKVWDTYTDVLGLNATVNIQLFEKGRYRQRTFRIGEMALWLLEPLDGPEAPGPGRGMNHFLQRHGEGMYMVTVGLGDHPERYCKRLESKGVRVYWDVPDSGVELTSAPRAPFEMIIHPLIHPRSTNGVLYELGRAIPGTVQRKAPENSSFKKVVGVSIMCKDNDEALKTYTEVLELDPPVRSTVYENGGYKEHTLAIGDVALELQQPVHGPDAPSRGGDMARALQQKGEGLYMITVHVGDPERYAKTLEAKGVNIDRVVPESGKLVSGPRKAPIPAGTFHGLIHPSHTHGVLWEFGSFDNQTLTM